MQIETKFNIHDRVRANLTHGWVEGTVECIKTLIVGKTQIVAYSLFLWAHSEECIIGYGLDYDERQLEPAKLEWGFREEKVERKSPEGWASNCRIVSVQKGDFSSSGVICHGFGLQGELLELTGIDHNSDEAQQVIRAAFEKTGLGIVPTFSGRQRPAQAKNYCCSLLDWTGCDMTKEHHPDCPSNK